MLLRAIKTLVIFSIAVAVCVSSVSCAKRRNLKEARAAYELLEIGCPGDACRSFNATCDPDRPDINYARDFAHVLCPEMSTPSPLLHPGRQAPAGRTVQPRSTRDTLAEETKSAS